MPKKKIPKNTKKGSSPSKNPTVKKRENGSVNVKVPNKTNDTGNAPNTRAKQRKQENPQHILPAENPVPFIEEVTLSTPSTSSNKNQVKQLKKRILMKNTQNSSDENGNNEEVKTNDQEKKEKKIEKNKIQKTKRKLTEENESDEPVENKTTPTKKIKLADTKKKASKAKEEVKIETVSSSTVRSSVVTNKNATITDWKNIDFSISKKIDYTLKITSWNVDGIKAWIKKDSLQIIKYEKPDILCLQEIKCRSEYLTELNIEGYYNYWSYSNKDGYSGVGILTKNEPLQVTYGINVDNDDFKGRCITAEYPNYFVINVYVPNAGRKLVTLPKRLEWNEAFNNYVRKLDDVKPVIICGDLNVAHYEIDLTNPKTNTKNAGFTKEEREGFTELLNYGFTDSFRALYPNKKNAYTFWSYMRNARRKNIGWRLDYFIVSHRYMYRVCEVAIRKDVLGSDHCPITLFLKE